MARHGKSTAWLLLLAISSLRVAVADGEPRFVAFSIREACRLAKAGQDSELLTSLGGMTRIGALVYDPEGKDLIVIGLAATSLPEARWDDLIVALRARVLHDEFPLVSIDPAEDTPQTRRQAVRFAGHLEDTEFGQDLLTCDVLLKRSSLELAQELQVPGIPSYRDLIEEAVRAEAQREGVRVLQFSWKSGNASKSYRGMAASNPRVYQARFWYKIQQPYVALCRPSTDRPEVFRIDEVVLMVDSQRVLGAETEANRKCRESFAAKWTERFPDVCEKHRVLRKLKILYDLTAVADAVRHLRQHVELPYLDYLLHEHRPSPTTTRRDYPLEELTGIAKRSDGATDLIHVSGGVELRPEVRNLNAGSVFGLRRLITKSRPSPDALTWELPVAGWRMPNARELFANSGHQGSGGEFRAATGLRSPGCHLFAQSVTLRPSKGGPDGVEGQSFSGFSLPGGRIGDLPNNSPTYKWNGVLIDPNVKRDKTPLSGKVREEVLKSRQKAKGPASEIKIPPLPIEDEEFRKGKPK